MKFYFYDRRGQYRREMQEDEVRKYLSPAKIEEAIEAKRADPQEEVSYMTAVGFIHCEFE